MLASPYRKLPTRCAGTLALFVLLLQCSQACAQEPSGAAPPALTSPSARSNPPQSEISVQNSPATFKVRVNLIQVRVVVRDEHDHPVAGLHREDFQLFDQGKPQIITNFAMDSAESRQQRAAAEKAAQDASTPNPMLRPDRFVAFVFDDMHMSMEDTVNIRSVATAFMNTMRPTDRLGVFSSSGQVHQEFTTDREALQRALLSITPRALINKGVATCPEMTYFLADQIANQQNRDALQVATSEVLHCNFRDDASKSLPAQSMAVSAARQMLAMGDSENQFTFHHLEEVLRDLAGKPGERVLLLVSPGFLVTSQFSDEMGIIDRANQFNIVVNTVDSRGLFAANTVRNIANPTTSAPWTSELQSTYARSAEFNQQGVLADFASGTGGTFFHNSNDFEGGLKMAGAAPEFSYMLGFSPANPKMDGRYHLLKVTLVGNHKYSIQARRGYYAPRKSTDPQELANQEIQEAAFSQDEIQDLPLVLNTQFFKTGDDLFRLTVVAHIGVKEINFRKLDGRNFDNLTVATIIFDENGNYVTGGQQFLELHLLDSTYERFSRTGIAVKSNFELKPGKYLVRQVVRSSEDARMAARNGEVLIPF